MELEKLNAYKDFSILYDWRVKLIYKFLFLKGSFFIVSPNMTALKQF